MHLLHNEYTGELRLGAVLPLPNMFDLHCLPASSKVSASKSFIDERQFCVEIEAALQEHRIDLGLVEGVFRLPNLKYTYFFGG